MLSIDYNHFNKKNRKIGQPALEFQNLTLGQLLPRRFIFKVNKTRKINNWTSNRKQLNDIVI